MYCTYVLSNSVHFILQRHACQHVPSVGQQWRCRSNAAHLTKQCSAAQKLLLTEACRCHFLGLWLTSPFRSCGLQTGLIKRQHERDRAARGHALQRPLNCLSDPQWTFNRLHTCVCMQCLMVWISQHSNKILTSAHGPQLILFIHKVFYCNFIFMLKLTTLEIIDFLTTDDVWWGLMFRQSSNYSHIAAQGANEETGKLVVVVF